MITQDHVVGGGIGVAIATYLPQVLTAQHWLGPDAPASAETGLILAIGTCVVVGIRWLIASRTQVAAPAATTAAVAATPAASAQPAPQA